MDRVRWAAAKCGAAPFIERMKDGYQTVVGIGGGRLSGGQRQLLALARTLYSDPPVVIYDEPTTHLDSAAEERLLSVLKDLMHDHTVILITHNPEHTDLTDHVLHFEKGRIVAPTEAQ